MKEITYNCEKLHKLIQEYKTPCYPANQEKKLELKRAIIKEMHCEKLEKLFESEKRCTARIIGRDFKYLNEYDFVGILTAIYRKFETIPKKYRDGCTITYCPTDPGSFPSAYKYIPDSTFLKFEWKKTGLFLVKVYRYTCNLNKETNCNIKLTETAEKIMVYNWNHSIT